MKNLVLTLLISLFCAGYSWSQDSTAVKIITKDAREFGFLAGVGAGSGDNDFVISGSLNVENLTLNIPNQTDPVIDLSAFALDLDLINFASTNQSNVFSQPQTFSGILRAEGDNLFFGSSGAGLRRWLFSRGGANELRLSPENGDNTDVYSSAFTFPLTGSPINATDVIRKDHLDAQLATVTRTDQENTFLENQIFNDTVSIEGSGRLLVSQIADFSNQVYLRNSNTYAPHLRIEVPASGGDHFVIDQATGDGAIRFNPSTATTEDETYRLSYTGDPILPQDLTDKEYVDSKTEGFKTNAAVALTSSSGQITPLGNDANIYTITLTEDTTINNPTSPVVNSIYQFIVQQDGTGLHTLSWGNQFAFPDGTAPSMTLDPGGLDVYTAVWNGTVFVTTYVQNFLTP